MVKKIQIDWMAETESVREAGFALLKVHDLYESLDEAGKERFDEIIELITEPEPVKEVESSEPSNTTLPVPEA